MPPHVYWANPGELIELAYASESHWLLVHDCYDHTTPDDATEAVAHDLHGLDQFYSLKEATAYYEAYPNKHQALKVLDLLAKLGD